MKNNRKMILCSALAAVMLLSGCQENKIVENGGVNTGIEVSLTTFANTEGVALPADEDSTTTSADDTTTTTTTTSDTSEADGQAAGPDTSEDNAAPADTAAQTTATPAATTAAPVQQTTAATAGQSGGGNSGTQAPAQQTKPAAATAAPQSPAQTYAETKEHVSGYRYGNVKYEIKHDMEYMKQLSSDFVGWLMLEDTPIDLPVVQGTDNKFYLTHNFYGEVDNTRVGATFADCHIPITETSRPQNIIIYGHNIRTGVGLAKVTNYYPARYGSLNYYRQPPIVHFETIDGGQSQYVVFAGMFVNTDTKQGDVFRYHTFRKFDNESIFYQYFEAVFDRSVFYNPDLEIRYDDEFLTLSTCYYPWGEAIDTRFVAFARRLRPGERVVTTKNAYVNQSPLYFDYYYKMNGGSWAGRKWSESLITGYSEWKKSRS